MGTAIGGHDQLKPSLYRVAEGNAVPLVPERDGIKKGGSVVLGSLSTSPTFTGTRICRPSGCVASVEVVQR
jgi:hypothetical protein